MTGKADMLREAPRDLVRGVVIVAEAMRAFVRGLLSVVGMIIFWGVAGLLILAFAAVVDLVWVPPTDMHVIATMLVVIAIILAVKP
jgi:hypothetical protein